jgi:hypothetical protein
MEDETDRPSGTLIMAVLAAVVFLAGTFGYVAAWAIDRWIL